MYINLDENYIIKSDENNYILCELRVASDSAKNAGETIEKPVGHYGTIQAALKGYAKISTRQPNQDGYKELLQKLDAIEQAILKVKIPSK